MGINKRLINSNLVKPLIKIALNLSILFGLVFLMRCSYQLFTTHPKDPLKDSILLILGVILWIIIIKLSRSRSRHYWLRYKGTKPNFKLTTFSIIVISLVFAFAGVQPMASYKDRIANKVTTTYENYQDEAEAKRVVEENKRITENAKMSDAGVKREWNFYGEYIVLFNEFRTKNDRIPLTFDAELNKLATQRAKEISEPYGFSHEGIKRYNLGENIAMMAYSSDSPKRLIELWANSSGHRSNMLSSSYHRTGFAKNGKYAVQIFD